MKNFEHDGHKWSVEMSELRSCVNGEVFGFEGNAHRLTGPGGTVLTERGSHRLYVSKYEADDAGKAEEQVEAAIRAGRLKAG